MSIYDLEDDYEFDKLDEERSINLDFSYPEDPNYEYFAYMEQIDFTEEKINDLQQGQGFVITSPKATIKKDIKDPNGIFSTKFGQRLGDANPYADRYSCQCGEYNSSMKLGLRCPKCGKICRFVDDNFKMFGWISINPEEYAIINPDMFKNLDNFFGRSKYLKNKKDKRGSVLANMIDYDKEINQNGFEVGAKEKPNEPFYGIGMIEFRERFDEILDYYYSKNHKTELYEDIKKSRHLLFISDIPVYTTLLRPMDLSQDTMYFEKTNGDYNLMVKLAHGINKNRRNIDRTPKLKNHQLYKLQMKYMTLYDEVVDILNGKKGQLRTLVSGRFNFSSRSVIKQNPDLRIDQVELPYVELVITQAQRIINILHRTYNISYQECYDKWSKAVSTIDPTIVNILYDIIRASGEGIPVIINRNPTISYGSILQMFCVGINFNYTMSIPLQILVPLAADQHNEFKYLTSPNSRSLFAVMQR